ncbi:hypothetical protein [Prevotella sp. AGR2160]|uniref:hypothetical protein n=1 Tax=Prevotella sp. AGR2160 TaxID=1280674 RepID=UPI00042597F4|nr:hypothetical protein [Prevotella sp. AGR2160]
MCGSIADITTAGKRYRKGSLWIIAAMMLIVLVIIRVTNEFFLVGGLVVTVVFSLLCSIVYGKAWEAVARRSPRQLAKFYLVAGTLRMLAAVLVFLVYALLHRDTGTLLGFTALFAGFYLVLLLFDCIFFARIEKKFKQLK